MKFYISVFMLVVVSTSSPFLARGKEIKHLPEIPGNEIYKNKEIQRDLVRWNDQIDGKDVVTNQRVDFIKKKVCSHLKISECKIKLGIHNIEESKNKSKAKVLIIKKRNEKTFFWHLPSGKMLEVPDGLENISFYHMKKDSGNEEVLLVMGYEPRQTSLFTEERAYLVYDKSTFKLHVSSKRCPCPKHIYDGENNKMGFSFSEEELDGVIERKNGVEEKVKYVLFSKYKPNREPKLDSLDNKRNSSK